VRRLTRRPASSPVESGYRRRPAGSLTAGAVLAIALVISIAGSIVTYRQVSNAFARYRDFEQANELVTSLLGFQLDEQSGLRGFLASGRRTFLHAYHSAQPLFGPTLTRLQDFVQGRGIAGAMPLVSDVYQSHSVWERDVARPLLAAPSMATSGQRLALDKSLVDRMRGDFAQLRGVLESQADVSTIQAQQLLLHAAAFTALLILVFGCAAIVADHIRSRTLAALARERAIADTLQQVFLAGWDTIPGMQVGTAYLSATREAALGGDLFDVHRTRDGRTMVLVADISGKGLDAAVETALVKYSVRTLAQEDDDPGSVLEKFNRTFINDAQDPTSFVSLFLGIVEHETRTLHYANAGHAPAYVRREAGVEQVPVTGPLIGVREDATFSSATLSLATGDTLVLATDGLTEARDSSGMMLEDERAMRWIGEIDGTPQAMADELVLRLQKYAGGRIADDLALLVVRLSPAPAGARGPSDLARENGPPVEAAPPEPASSSI